jgi:CRP-like cAMP-binding protein
MTAEDSNIKIIQYKRGDMIIKEGDIGTNAFIINNGYVEIKKYISESQEVTITKLGAGEIFGEMSLFDDHKRSASVYALTDVELKVIDKSIFDEALKRTPPLIRIILNVQSQRLKKAANNIAALRVLFKKVD